MCWLCNNSCNKLGTFLEHVAIVSLFPDALGRDDVCHYTRLHGRVVDKRSINGVLHDT